ncbi:hypothetical protein BJY04DRAFT_223237 [Aspergillus karnatakaensis]|uniref:uncharacterized protein n=1 Tax=Aspergillus karnatakaensis TaxID=1810916 RepID=UPI003CCD7F01
MPSLTLVSSSPGGFGYESVFSPSGPGLAAQSFRLIRMMFPKEQHDISVAEKLEEWKKGDSNGSCERFVRSYFARDAVAGCQNVDVPFTCLKYWWNVDLSYIG